MSFKGLARLLHAVITRQTKAAEANSFPLHRRPEVDAGIHESC
jgi:hypothetical protein